MGRAQVIQITCDRCTRVEHRPIRPEDELSDEERPAAFAGTYRGESVRYDDLCTGCEEIVGGRFAEISKKLSKASPIRAIDKKLHKKQG